MAGNPGIEDASHLAEMFVGVIEMGEVLDGPDKDASVPGFVDVDDMEQTFDVIKQRIQDMRKTLGT